MSTVAAPALPEAAPAASTPTGLAAATRRQRRLAYWQAMPLGLGWAEDRIVAVAGMVDQVNTVEVQEFDAASLQLQHSSIDSDGIPSVDQS